jgi:molybdopterin-synthase adenylyltransferase
MSGRIKDMTDRGPGHPLSQNELLRYHRQLIIPQIGEEGQKRIGEAKVFLAGAGGLGSISAYYLAAAGVGYLRIVDKDVVDLPNLNRQIIHWTSDIGEAKVESARRKLNSLNPECLVDQVREEMRADNIIRLIGDCSIIVDATDNFETRRVLNRASLRKGIPLIYGGVDQFSGMVTTFIPGKTPCFECLFPGAASTGKTIGVIGPLPGLIASLQTLEVLKIILGLGGLLTGRLLFFSGLDMTFKEITIGINPDCAICGPPAREEK